MKGDAELWDVLHRTEFERDEARAFESEVRAILTGGGRPIACAWCGALADDVEGAKVHLGECVAHPLRLERDAALARAEAAEADYAQSESNCKTLLRQRNEAADEADTLRAEVERLRVVNERLNGQASVGGTVLHEEAP